MKQMPTVQKYMTTSPLTIQSGETITKARSIMEEKKIRHLPVMEGPQLIGILTDRDIKLALSFETLDPDKIIAYDVCIEDPYAVSPQANLDEVANEMAEKHIGAAIVVDNEEVVGILTTVDICRILSEILQQRFHN